MSLRKLSAAKAPRCRIAPLALEFRPGVSLMGHLPSQHADLPAQLGDGPRKRKTITEHEQAATVFAELDLAWRSALAQRRSSLRLGRLTGPIAR